MPPARTPDRLGTPSFPRTSSRRAPRAARPVVPEHKRELVDETPRVVCPSKLNGEGLYPAITWIGSPGASAGSGFTISATSAIAHQFGLMFYGYAQSTAPFQGGYLCVKPPFRRTPIQAATGSGLCGGSYSIDFNAYIALGTDPALLPGVNVFARYWMRDPPAAFTTGYTNALTFTICQ